MLTISLLTLATVVSGPDCQVNSYRDDRPPKEWRIENINEGLPLRWEKGAVHLLAWEIIEDDRPHRSTQILVLKKFEQPTEDGGYSWVLAQLFLNPKDEKRPWSGPCRVPGPLPIGKQLPKLTDAQLFGYEFYKVSPTDVQIAKLVKETRWKPELGPQKAFCLSGECIVTAKLAAGGVYRPGWVNSLGREAPPILFPELKKSHGKKE